MEKHNIYITHVDKSEGNTVLIRVLYKKQVN
jgi:hypothetical protein